MTTKYRYSPYRPKRYKNQVYSHIEDEAVLVKKLIKSVAGIIAILTITILTLQFFGPKLFSVLGLLSLERFEKKEEKKMKSQTPVITDYPKFTNSSPIAIHGFAEAESTIRLFVNGPEAGTTVSESGGKFTFDQVELLNGQNMIFSKANREGKEESEKSETVFVVLDTEKPKIEIIKPSDGENIESVDSRYQVIGKVSENSTIKVNTHLTVLDFDGNFQALVSLKGGENKIIVEAVDQAGNEATKSIAINFKKR